MTAIENPLAEARFLLSAARNGQLPRDGIAEIAFAGRSNAGKSSALNRLCGRRGLARVSKTPGRTQLLNLFVLPCGARLVDLPGYGFARAPEAVRRQWGALVGEYLETRTNLYGVVLLMDARHPLTALDVQMLDWAQAQGRPVHILLTKADKLGRGTAAQALAKLRTSLIPRGGGVSAQLFSALTDVGLTDARQAIAERLGIAAVAQPPPDSCSAEVRDSLCARAEPRRPKKNPVARESHRATSSGIGESRAFRPGSRGGERERE